MNVDIKKVAMAYFEAVESRSHEAIMDLFDEKCGVFFANFGVSYGRQAFEEVNKQLVQQFKQLFFKKEEFIFTVQDYRVVVEGVEYGKLANGQIIKDNRMCNVFEINPVTGLITRMYAYTDPNLGLKE
ncbi:nuclear transport factor 2 family protein [Tetragenococcus solitarius]|uniref:SnoaL-like domain-containing protein n=1 Tax=Tetragenococcus solitarius TaxID=71453 RepID=A0ABN3Y9X2_9ENTE|nr:nuclear transport factor 2 family protein [Tetragenococcus solitarius]